MDRLAPGRHRHSGRPWGSQVSGRQRQRIALARLLLSPARFLICDEPAAHLDPAGARALLEHLIAIHGTDNRERLLILFDEQLRERDDLLNVVIEYWFTNNLGAYLTAKERAKPEEVARVAQIRKEAASETRAKIHRAVEAKARLMLLDQVMVNGKKLRACTGEECLAMSKTYGRWLAAVAKEVPPATKVGEALSEDSLHHLLERAK